MTPPADAFAGWHEFYALLGTASATMVGLLFVAATVASGVFRSNRRAAQRVFLSATVVNFSLILAACLIVLSPMRNWGSHGALIVGCGVFGLAHSALACRDTLRDGLFPSIDLEDRTWYLGLPIMSYLLVTASGIALVSRAPAGGTVLALSAGMLLGVGIHDAWDITVWSVTRRQ